MSLAERAACARRGELGNARILKQSRVRLVLRDDDAVIKLFLERPGRARREARALVRAAERGIPVPTLLESGPDWVATRFADGREAERGDLALLLPVVRNMHAQGMLHRDLHLGNFRIANGRPLLLDLQRARFLYRVPRLLQRRELGFLAYSLGEPLPPELERVRFWRDLRAQRHWRSRTKRCLVESSGFTAFGSGFRRREVDGEKLAAALAAVPTGELLKQAGGGRIVRQGDWILKEHASVPAARAAWLAGRGLEARGIATARALAWQQRWLVMEDAGATVDDWVAGAFASAPEAERVQLANSLGSLLADLHRRGIYHVDLKANNIAWSPGAAPALLDYGRVRFGWRVPRRRRIKNLAQLNAALPDLVPAALRERALQTYLRESALRDHPDRLRKAVVRESLRRRHRWSGCDSPP